MRVRGVSRYVVLFMKNIVLSTPFWCKAPLHFDGFRNADCWHDDHGEGYRNLYVAIYKPQAIVEHNISGSYIHKLTIFHALNHYIFCQNHLLPRTSSFTISYLNLYMSRLCVYFFNQQFNFLLIHTYFCGLIIAFILQDDAEMNSKLCPDCSVWLKTFDPCLLFLQSS